MRRTLAICFLLLSLSSIALLVWSVLRVNDVSYSFFASVVAAVSMIMLPGVISGMREAERAHRQREGRCLNCGYDMRASAGRCPECGTTPAAK